MFSLISFRLNFPFHLKLISILIGIALLTEVFANYLLFFFHLNTNHPVYNIYILIQGCIYAIYYKLIITVKAVKRGANIFLMFFFIFWFATTFFVFGLNVWNSYAVMIGDLFIICMSAAYLFKFITSDDLLNLKHCPEFWIAVGSIIYFSCELPFTGIFNYLADNFETTTIFLYNVLQVLNIIMYSIFIYAFLCRLKTRTTKFL